MKRILAFLTSLCLIWTMGLTVNAVSPVQIQARDSRNDSPNYNGYTITVYLLDVSGEQISSNSYSLEDSTITIDVPDGVGGLAYEVHDSAGNTVNAYEQILTGNSAYWNTSTPIEVPVTSADKSSDSTEIVYDTNVTEIDLSGVGGQTTKPDVSSEIVLEPLRADTATNNSIFINVTSDTNVDLLTNQGFSLYGVRDTEQYRIDIPNLATTFVDMPDDPSTWSYATSTESFRGWSEIVITDVSDNTLEISVTPSCILYITDSSTTDNLSFKIQDKPYATANNYTMGVVNGEQYTIINNKTNKAYSFTVPSLVTECYVDIGTTNGIPVNDLANQNAELTNTGDTPNPYNIPLTLNRGTSKSISIVTVLSAVFISWFILKKLKKK